MDAEGLRRWQNAISPFDGTTIFLSGDLVLTDLRTALIPIVGALSDHFPGVELYRLDDWHQHDGYINCAKPTSWQDLDGMLLTDDAFKSFSTGEDHVRTALFPTDYAFYLRVYLDVEALCSPTQHKTIRGDFDVTCQASLANQLKELLTQTGVPIQSEPAKAFFDKRYAG